MNSNKLWRLALVIVFSAVTTAAAQEFEDKLLGDAGGVRKTLLDNGISLEADLTSDMASVLSGGVHRRTDFISSFDLYSEIDTAKAGLWEDGDFFFHGLLSFGGFPSENSGDYQIADNYEAGKTSKLVEAWYEHSFCDEKVAFLVGLHDMNTDFQVLKYASFLVNSSFGLTPEIPFEGVSTWPTTAVGARLKVLPTDTSYVLAAVYDGIPGDPNHPEGTHIRLDSGDGAMMITEMGIASSGEDLADAHFKLAHGAWVRTTDYQDFLDRERTNNAGYYVVGERSLYCDGDCGKGLGGFFQFGYADPKKNRVGIYWGTGLAYTGLFPTRDSDILSFGMNQIRNTPDYMDAYPDSGRTETVFELNYMLQMTPWLYLQPDFQYIHRPNTDKNIDDAVVSILRIAMQM